MKQAFLASAVLAVGLVFSAPAMANDIYGEECHVPNGALVQLEKGNVDTTVKILAGANTNQGTGDGGEAMFFHTFKGPGGVHINCFVLHFPVPSDPDLSLGDAFDFDEGMDCLMRRDRQWCRGILSDPGNSN